MEENGSFDVLTLLLMPRVLASSSLRLTISALIMERDRQLEENYIAARTEHERVQAEYEAAKAELDAKAGGVGAGAGGAGANDRGSDRLD